VNTGKGGGIGLFPVNPVVGLIPLRVAGVLKGFKEFPVLAGKEGGGEMKILYCPGRQKAVEIVLSMKLTLYE